MRLTTTAEALKQARKAGGKSQMDMAAEMDITRRTVQHWENGESEPTVSQLMEWIRTAGENPVPYLIALAYPESDIIDGLDDEGIAKGYEPYPGTYPPGIKSRYIIFSAVTMEATRIV